MRGLWSHILVPEVLSSIGLEKSIKLMGLKYVIQDA